MIDLKVEQQVLGCILLCDDGLAEAKKVLTADDFHGENRVIYQAMLEVDRKGITLDLVTLFEEIRAENAGIPLHYMAILTSLIPVEANASYYANLLHIRNARTEE